MSVRHRYYAHDTWVRQLFPFGWYIAGAAMCSDGKVRKLMRIGERADSFFSVPASVKVKGKTVAGFVTVETREGYITDAASDPLVVKFVAYQYRKNAGMLPRGAWKQTYVQWQRREAVIYAIKLSRKAREASQFKRVRK